MRATTGGVGLAGVADGRWLCSVVRFVVADERVEARQRIIEDSGVDILRVVVDHRSAAVERPKAGPQRAERRAHAAVVGEAEEAARRVERWDGAETDLEGLMMMMTMPMPMPMMTMVMMIWMTMMTVVIMVMAMMMMMMMMNMII